MDLGSLRAWAKECTKNGYCAIPPEDYYRQTYVKVKNGWPILIDTTKENIASKYNLENIFNTLKHRTWIRSVDLGGIYSDHDLNVQKFWNGCSSPNYYGSSQQTNSFDRWHFKLANGQEFKIQNTIHSFMITSGKETKYIYHNIADSWIDVALYSKHDPEADWFFYAHYRVYGTNPDPWDAPEWLRDSIWPPPDDHWPIKRIEVCSHLTGHTYGTVDYDNVNDIDDLSRSSTPIETSIIPIEGTWSGLVWENRQNLLVYDVLSTQFKKVRIEKYPEYHRIYVSYGDGAAIGATGPLMDLANQQDKWDSRSYCAVVDLLSDGTVEFVDHGYYISFPIDENDAIVYDTELGISKLGSNYSHPSVIAPILSTEGQIELDRIYYEIALSFGLGEDFTTEYTVYTAELNSLIKKQGSI